MWKWWYWRDDGEDGDGDNDVIVWDKGDDAEIEIDGDVFSIVVGGGSSDGDLDDFGDNDGDMIWYSYYGMQLQPI